MKNWVGRKEDFIEKNTLVIQTEKGMEETKNMFIKGVKRLSSPTCRVPAVDSARVNTAAGESSQSRQAHRH